MAQEFTRKTYTLVFLWLMVLLVLTVAVSYIPYRNWGIEAIGVSVALLIATLKAIFVVLYFMHVRRGPILTKVFIFFAIGWLGILFVLTLSDYLTRGWLPLSDGWSRELQIPPP